jgi:hypothetical protein
VNWITTERLQYKILTAGTGVKPTPTSKSRFIEEGKTIDGAILTVRFNAEHQRIGVTQSRLDGRYSYQCCPWKQKNCIFQLTLHLNAVAKIGPKSEL